MNLGIVRETNLVDNHWVMLEYGSGVPQPAAALAPFQTAAPSLDYRCRHRPLYAGC